MNIFLSSVHINTLCKLKELAEKHNCRINFGVNHNSGTEIDWDLLEEKTNLTDEIREELNKVFCFTNCYFDNTNYWFELYDKNNMTYNTLSFIEAQTSFTYDDCCLIDHEETEKWIEENMNDDYDHFFSCSNGETKINGFKGVKTDDVFVYREGMTLKFFGDLVCEYLDEERISEVY